MGCEPIRRSWSLEPSLPCRAQIATKSRIIAALTAMLIIGCSRGSAQGAVINATDVLGAIALDQTNFNFGGRARTRYVHVPG